MPLRYLTDVVTLTLVPEKCTGCGRCVEVCPHGVFALETDRARITDRDACMECGACARNCPVGAVEVHSGVGCAQAVINGVLSGTEPCSDCGEDSGGTCCS